MSDPHAIHRHGRITLNATLALAAHHGVILDQEGHTVALPDDEPLRETVARVLHARHGHDTLTRWEDATTAARAWWQSHADAVIDAVDAVPTATTDHLARLLYAHTALGSWGHITSGDLARCLITAEHVARIIARRTRRDLERAQAEASRTTGACPVCGADRLDVPCIPAGHHEGRAR